MRRIVALVLVCCLWSFGFAEGSHGGSHSSKASKPAKAKVGKADKTVHVRGYIRKDGTYVAPYDRRPPGTASTTTASVFGSSSVHMYHSGYMADGLPAPPTVQLDKHGRIKRSRPPRQHSSVNTRVRPLAKDQGAVQATSLITFRALKCGGPDDPSNMQWQTTPDAKAKDKLRGSVASRAHENNRVLSSLASLLAPFQRNES